MQSSWRISPLTSVQSETFETICWCSQPPRWLRMEHVIPQSDGLMLLGQPRIPQHWRLSTIIIGAHITTIIRGFGDRKKNTMDPPILIMSNNVKILVVLRRTGLHPNWAPILFPFLGRTHISPMKRHMVLMGRVRMPIILPPRMLCLVARWFIIQQSQKSEAHGTNLTPKLCKRLLPTTDRLVAKIIYPKQKHPYHLESESHL